jgi:DNA polymerase-4
MACYGRGMPLRKIIHVDMDAFYASVEQRDHPELRGRAVAVGHGAKRGVVAAASYEARAFGVRSAMPSTTALRQCAELVFVPPRFDVYRAVSRQIHAIFADYTAVIEPLALDEAYLDVTENRRGLPTAAATAKEIRARIFHDTGLTASAGVSYNKFLAKLASGQRKPNGQFVITPELGPDFIAALPVAQFHGVGPVTAAKMQRLGIRTGTDLRMVSLAFLQQRFGKAAAWYLGIANGEDNRPVVADRPRKSSGSETTFERDLTTPTEIVAGIEAMADEVWAWCEKANAFGRTVTVKVKFADFRLVTRSRSFSSVIARHDLLRQASLELARTLLPTAMAVRLLGVTVSNFDQAPSEAAGALPLFEVRTATMPRPDAAAHLAAIGTP